MQEESILTKMTPTKPRPARSIPVHSMRGSPPRVSSPVRIDANADSDLKVRVASYLAGRRHSTLRELDVSTFNGTVTIRGIVKSFYEKQLAINSCQRVAGVLKLIDQVEVV